MTERDIWECANQLGGYIGPNTPDDLAEFLARESGAAGDLAKEIESLRTREREAQDRYKATEDELRATEARLARVERRNVELEEALTGAVKAWDDLEGNRHHTPAKVQKWLMNNMWPAIKVARALQSQETDDGR